jgi:type I restriction enzyme, S subunit
MESNYKKLGDCIRLVNRRNKNLEVSNLLGINIFKKFMPSVANTSESDLSKYKIIKKGQFAYSAMQVGRDETIRVVLFTEDKPAIISPAYLVFEVVDLDVVLPEYLMMLFQRPESDRYGWFISDGSVRSSLDWERFCEIEIPIPEDIEVQKSVVVIYNELLKNQSCFEKSLKDLQFICDTYIEKLIRAEEPKTLGCYIEKTNKKNINDKINKFVGVSERKEFRGSDKRVNMNNLTNHPIVRKDEFAYTPRMNPFKPLAIALSHYDYPVIVSPANLTFIVKDHDLLLPEYLLLFLMRGEFDRYAAYHAWGSARDTFDWKDMCAVKLPIPNIEIQKSIVTIHRALRSRKRINENLKNLETPLCRILMKGVANNLAKN